MLWYSRIYTSHDYSDIDFVSIELSPRRARRVLQLIGKVHELSVDFIEEFAYDLEAFSMSDGPEDKDGVPANEIIMESIPEDALCRAVLEATPPKSAFDLAVESVYRVVGRDGVHWRFNPKHSGIHCETHAVSRDEIVALAAQEDE